MSNFQIETMSILLEYTNQKNKRSQSKGASYSLKEYHKNDKATNFIAIPNEERFK